MLRTIWAALCVSGFVTVASSAQVPLSANYFGADSQVYDAGLFTPAESLTSLSESTFTTLGHPLFPNYGVRIKQSKFCDETVRLEVVSDCLSTRTLM